MHNPFAVFPRDWGNKRILHENEIVPLCLADDRMVRWPEGIFCKSFLSDLSPSDHPSKFFPMTFLIFLPTPARTRIIPPNFWLGGSVCRSAHNCSSWSRRIPHRRLQHRFSGIALERTLPGRSRLRQFFFDLCFVGLQSLQLFFRFLQNATRRELAEIDLEKRTDNRSIDHGDQLAEPLEALILIFNERIALSESCKRDLFAQV